MRIAYIKTNLEASGYVIHGLGLLSAISKRYGHESVWGNPTVSPQLPEAEVVAITACSDAFPLACDVARSYKQFNPSIQVWVGGPHATFAPQDFTSHPEFDFIVRGDGEAVWEAFCQGSSPPTRIIHGEPVSDINQLPFVDRAQAISLLNALLGLCIGFLGPTDAS
jgi:hypothetical protein